MYICATHLTEEILEEVTIVEDAVRHRFILFSTIKTGIIIRKDLQPQIKRIDDRICTAIIKMKEHKLHIISIYAHTHKRSEENNELRENFYECLESILEKIPKRDIVILLGDFNAKTGTDTEEFPINIGKYGKRILNSSGRHFLEMCRKHDLVLTNTRIKHKICHGTTWTAPFRNFIAREGEERRNPVRNQIDYILVRNKHKKFVTDSRSYSGIDKETDHKLVTMLMKIEWYKSKTNGNNIVKIDVNNLTNEEKKEEYKTEISKEIDRVKQKNTAQEKWNRIGEICKESGKKVLVQ